jgi:hypothetical protein
MANPVLPPNIWLHVASFLPGLLLCELISLNSTFFEIAMDYRYRQMSFAYFDNRMLRSISHLRYNFLIDFPQIWLILFITRDPAVAKRVRILHIYPGFLKEILQRDTIIRHDYSFHHMLVKLLDPLEKLFCNNPQSKHPKSHLIQSLKQTEDAVRILLEVLRGLPNITDCYSRGQPKPTNNFGHHRSLFFITGIDAH